jgi:hypothetical protein
MADKKEGKSSRRDAIKRLGLLGVGVGAALIPSRSPAPLVNCYSSCSSDSYDSCDNYTSNGDHMSVYCSSDDYSSSCYSSCQDQ